MIRKGFMGGVLKLSLKRQSEAESEGSGGHFSTQHSRNSKTKAQK